MNCEFCGREESLPFVCNYCGGTFCADHRLPEAHQCKGDLAQKRTLTAPPTTTFTWSDSSYPTAPAIKPGSPFSEVEVRDILVAYLGLGVAFFIAFVGIGTVLSLKPGNFFVKIPRIDLSPFQVLGVSLIAVGPGFVLHELSHKFTARRYGYWAEFRVWPLGLLLALVTSMIGFIFAAPGATYISGINITKPENGRISIAGPLTNVAVALAFFPLLVFGEGFWGYLGSYGVFINIWLAIFNMLPIMPLDGAKVFSWSKIRWVLLFAPLMIIFLYLVGVFG
ncbi:MAG: AN1-type zinc finger domain-containing protein [Nitrososphaerales archaeon]